MFKIFSFISSLENIEIWSIERTIYVSLIVLNLDYLSFRKINKDGNGRVTVKNIQQHSLVKYNFMCITDTPIKKTYENVNVDSE